MPESEHSAPKPASENTVPELHKMQLQHVVETYRVQLTLLVQILTILSVGDVSITGFAVNARAAGVLAIGAVFPLSMLLVVWTVARLSIPILFTAIRIESLHDGQNMDGVISTFLCFTQSVPYVRELQQIARI